jgi:hypothetical protein
VLTHGGPRYTLGTTQDGYAIWATGQAGGEPVRRFGLGDAGWREAYTTLLAWDPEAKPVENAAVNPYGTPPAAPPAPQGSPPGWGPPGAYQPGPPAGYGQPAPYGYGYPVAQRPPTNGVATAGGVVGIVGAVLSLIPFLGILLGLIMGPIAIVLSCIGLGTAGPEGTGKSMAVTGLVLGILTVVFKLIPGVNLL